MKAIVSTILIVAIVVVLIWWIVRWTTQSSTILLKGPLCVNGAVDCPGGYSDKTPVIKNNNKLSGNVASSNYTISLWYYVTQWTITDHDKMLFIRLNNGAGSIGGPEISLGAQENNLYVRVACHDTTNANTSNLGTITCDTSPDGVTSQYCNIDNVPVQRWVNVLVSVYGRTLDVYIDGKLSKTCLLPGLAIASAAGECIVAPINGKNPVKIQPMVSTGPDGTTHTAKYGSNCPTTDTNNSKSDTSSVNLQAPNKTAECTQQIAEANSSFHSSAFQGYIDNVRYWDSATNPQQAYNIYKDGPSSGGFGTNFFNDYYMEVGFYDKGKNEFSFRV